MWNNRIIHLITAVTCAIVPVAPTSIFSPFHRDVFYFYQLQTLKTTLGHFIPYVRMPPTSETLFKLGVFLNFQELFPKSIECNPESHSIGLRRRLQGVFMADIEQWFLWRSAERGGGVRNVMTEFGPVERGYLGLGNCGFSVYVLWRDKQTTKELRQQERKPCCCVFREIFVLLRVYVNKYFTLSSSLDSFLFSSVSRTLSLSYFSLYSASNSSRSLWLEEQKCAHTHTHRLLNLWHCINLHLFPNQNSQLQNQSWRRHFNMNAKSISQKGEFFQRFWFCGTVFCFQPPGHCVFEHSVIKCWIISQSTAILISFFPHISAKPESNAWYQNQVWFIQPKHINAVRIWYSAVFKNE